MAVSPTKPLVAIACGGTGGHLFPGLAVAGQLRLRGCEVLALISPKDVDQKAIRQAEGIAVQVLPAVGLVGHHYLSFLRGFWKSYRMAVALFARQQPQAVLAMGGFTSAPPIHAGRKFDTATYLHESNTIPGRANRWLARFVHQAFVGFPSAAARLRHSKVQHTGTPVRPQFQVMDKALARLALQLQPDRPVLLIMGGSQGASGINQLVCQALPMLAQRLPGWQYVHLTGARDHSQVRAAYQQLGLPALIRDFSSEMECLLGAATLAISRAGASSLAELAAMQVPAILIPYPSAADNHQYFNARALVDAQAALLLEQARATPENVAAMISDLAGDEASRARMADAVYRWHKPQAAEHIAECMLTLMRNLYGGQAAGGRERAGQVAKVESVVT